jgi:hypothetical protein
MDIIIKKEDLKNKLKSKYFIIVLSNEENLRKCINNKIAVFPETDNGVWAYLDICEGDYISLYYNGRIFNLYKVDKKFIPEYYNNGNKAIGDEEYDPVALPNGEKWKSIKTKKGNIYFPYRLSLSLVKETNFATSLIFKPGFERFGINLIPRVSLKKSHFQLSISDVDKAFKIKNLQITKRGFSLHDFIEINRKHNTSDANFLGINIMNKEIFLQTLIKRVLEASISKYANIIFDDINFNIHDLEFLSEQAVYGGEADIVIANKSKNIAFIEVKNGSILNRKGDFTKVGQRAYNQIKSYRDIINPEKEIKKFIAGKRSFASNDIVLKISIKERKNEKVYVIEFNTDFNVD